jgi:hypothetical protein
MKLSIHFAKRGTEILSRGNVKATIIRQDEEYRIVDAILYLRVH